MKQSRRRRGRSVIGVERLRVRREHVKVEREFLLDQVVQELVEGWEWCDACDDSSKMIVPLVQP
jgi:hypothetical protein